MSVPNSVSKNGCLLPRLQEHQVVCQHWQGTQIKWRVLGEYVFACQHQTSLDCLPVQESRVQHRQGCVLKQKAAIAAGCSGSGQICKA